MFNKVFFSAILAVLFLGQGVVSQNLGSVCGGATDPACPTGTFCCTPGPVEVGVTPVSHCATVCPL